MIEDLAVSWEDALFGIVAALVWLSVSLVSCPRVCVKSVSKLYVQITPDQSSLGPIMVSVENDDPEFQEAELEACGLPGVWLVSPLSLPPSQITPSQGVFLSVPTPAQHPLRC